MMIVIILEKMSEIVMIVMKLEVFILILQNSGIKNSITPYKVILIFY